MNRQHQFQPCRADAATPTSWMVLGVAVAATLLIPAQTVLAAGACSDTAQAAFNACKNEVKDDEWIGRGNCYNLSDPDEQMECFDGLAADTDEAKAFCREQRDARLDLCAGLTTPAEVAGDAPYDPDFSPFVDPTDIGETVDPNPFFPLVNGYQRVYRAYETEGGLELVEQITVKVTSATKKIPEQVLGEDDDPPGFRTDCVVVNDLVEEVLDVDTDTNVFGDITEKRKLEDTDDWYTQRGAPAEVNGHAPAGDVIYCGELARDFLRAVGDDPDDQDELFSIEGSFKWGRDGAKPGILIEADPVEGHVYRQEHSLGNAEDAAEVVNDNYVYGTGQAEDAYVPAEANQLMNHLCGAGAMRRCVVTRDFTPIEPDTEEFKFYAEDIGPILEVNPEDGSFVLLVDCSYCGLLLPDPPSLL